MDSNQLELLMRNDPRVMLAISDFAEIQGMCIEEAKRFSLCVMNQSDFLAVAAIGDLPVREKAKQHNWSKEGF